jgi:hypothetical protein
MFAPMKKLRDVKVVLRTAEGNYLAGEPGAWEFSGDIANAAVFNYLADDIEAQIQSVIESQGITLEAVHVASRDVHETCDRCEDVVMPAQAYFNGSQFLCPDCRGGTPRAFAA